MHFVDESLNMLVLLLIHWNMISSLSIFRINQQIRSYGLEPKDLEPDERDEEYVPKKSEQVKRGRPEKPYAELGPRQKRARLQPTLDNVREVAKNTGPNGLNVYQVLGELGKMEANSKVDRASAKMFGRIADGEDPFAHRTMTVERALAMKVQSKKGVRTFDVIRKFVKQGLDIPS